MMAVLSLALLGQTIAGAAGAVVAVAAGLVVALILGVGDGRPQVTACTTLLISLLLMGVWAHDTGAPLAMFVCFALVAGIVLDGVAAKVVTGRATITLVVEPADGVVGQARTITVAVAGTSCPLHVRVPPSKAARAEPPTTGSLSTTALVRGVATTMEVEIESHGLCGTMGYLRRGPRRLVRPVATGPRPVEPEHGFPDLWRLGADERAAAAFTGEVVRGVRGYVPGDRLRLVHWRATARLGDLVVKEVDETQTPELVLVLHLGVAGDAAELAAGRASWYAAEGLRRGCSVVLVTREATGPAGGPVRSLSQLNWRLAAAVLGPPGVARVRGRHLVVTDEGDTWR